MGHPGAREANVVRYIDTLLGALALTPERIHAGGPWSNRSGGDADHMATFLALSATQRQAWARRLGLLQKEYVDGVKALDAAASGDFVAADNITKDQVLTAAGAFRDLLFTHAIEGTYSIPEYGGNEGLSGWHEIKFKGDSQPRGYTPAEVTNSDGVDVYVPTGVVADADRHVPGGGVRRGGPSGDEADEAGWPVRARPSSSAAGRAAAPRPWSLAEAGWNVVIFEKGRNYFGDLTSQAPSTLFSNDELKGRRGSSRTPTPTSSSPARTGPTARAPRSPASSTTSPRPSVAAPCTSTPRRRATGTSTSARSRCWARSTGPRSSTGRSTTPRSRPTTTRSSA